MKQPTRLIIRPSAQKQLQKLPLQIQKDIISKLRFYVHSTMPLSFAKRLTNYELGEYRYRIDKDYRVVFDVKGDTIVVTEIGHRSKMYAK